MPLTLIAIALLVEPSISLAASMDRVMPSLFEPSGQRRIGYIGTYKLVDGWIPGSDDFLAYAEIKLEFLGLDPGAVSHFTGTSSNLEDVILTSPAGADVEVLSDRIIITFTGEHLKDHFDSPGETNDIIVLFRDDNPDWTYAAFGDPNPVIGTELLRDILSPVYVGSNARLYGISSSPSPDVPSPVNYFNQIMNYLNDESAGTGEHVKVADYIHYVMCYITEIAKQDETSGLVSNQSAASVIHRGSEALHSWVAAGFRLILWGRSSTSIRLDMHGQRPMTLEARGGHSE